jgi:3-phenylpropionate/trans-cinnamate dioxygenase alpha subunit
MTDSSLDIDDLRHMVDFERGLIEGRIFVDEGIYRREAEQLFLRSWLFLAHECQLKAWGDYVTTYMGTDPVIVVRQQDGTIKAFLNSCPHRGASICRADSGNAKVFVCPFHGWTFQSDGRLRGMPNETTTYRGDLDKSRWGLTEARVEIYKGLVFGCFEPEAPPLIDYLGDMAWYLDCVLDRCDGGTEFVGGVHKMRLTGNWKLAAEQFSGDGYHTIMTHASVPGSWADPTAGTPQFSYSDFFKQAGRQFSSLHGHSMGGFIGTAAETPASANIPSSFSRKKVSADLQLVSDYYESTREEVAARRGRPKHFVPPDGSGFVFPNLLLLVGVNGCSSIGVCHPKGPNKFEFWRWGIVDKAAPQAVKEAMVRCLHVWPVGLGDSDDAENWSSVQSQMNGAKARKQKLNYQMGLGAEGADPMYPGTLNPSLLGDYPQRRFYRRWFEFMSSVKWPVVETPST